jgi:hypothetical protein
MYGFIIHLYIEIKAPCPDPIYLQLNYSKPYVNPTRFRWLLDDNNIGGWSLMIADTG